MSNTSDQNKIADLFTQLTAEDKLADDARPVELDETHEASHSSGSPAMRLESLHITNLWSYDQTEVEFKDGVTVIAGMNGSGKSSLLESIFFALYGSKAGTTMKRSLSDIVRIGTDLGSVSLKFQYGSHSYTCRMSVRRKGEKGRTESESCDLHRDDGEKWSGVRDVIEQIEKLFGMNAEDFTNCIYVRQGQIDQLIRATGRERRDMIDRLLRLEKLDKYARRSEDGARRAVNRYHDGLKQSTIDKKAEIKRLENEQAQKELAEVETQLKAKRVEIEDIEEKFKKAESLKNETEQQLKKRAEITAELKALSDSIEKKEAQLKERESETAKIAKTLEAIRSEYEEQQVKLSNHLEALDLPNAAVLEQLDYIQAWDEIEALSTNLAKTRERQEVIREQAENLQSEANLENEKIAKKREEILTAIAQSETQLKSLNAELDRICKLVDEGKCPQCGQPIESGDFSEQIEGQRAKIAELEKKLKVQKAEEQELKVSIEQKKERNETQIAKLREDFRALEKRKAQLEEAKGIVEKLLQLKQQAELRRENRKSLVQVAESLRDEIAQMKSKQNEQSQKIENVKELEAKQKQIEPVLVKLGQQLKDEQKQYEELINKRGVLQSKIEQLAQLKTKLESAEKELESAERIQSELNALSQFYGDLKAELRAENIKALEHYFNEFFRVMDSGASYSRVKIDDEYDIVVELKDGGAIRPELLSGGERALINIALRSAIHQVLSQATSRMPLILDEPTIYLDRDRITRLQYLLEALGSRIGQVIVVSHEAGLVEGADHEYRTEKRADNTSHIYQIR